MGEFTCEAFEYEGQTPCPSCERVGYCQLADKPVLDGPSFGDYWTTATDGATP